MTQLYLYQKGAVLGKLGFSGRRAGVSGIISVEAFGTVWLRRASRITDGLVSGPQDRTDSQSSLSIPLTMFHQLPSAGSLVISS